MYRAMPHIKGRMYMSINTGKAMVKYSSYAPMLAALAP
jgi:hypothetical protein